MYIRLLNILEFENARSLKLLGFKVLSREMDPAKIRLIRYVVIKERGAEGF